MLEKVYWCSKCEDIRVTKRAVKKCLGCNGPVQEIGHIEHAAKTGGA